MDVLDQKVAQYVEKDLISREKADTILKIARGERGQGPEANPLGGADAVEGDATRGTRKLNLAEMAALLAKREGQMRDGGNDEHHLTDQCHSPGGCFCVTRRVPKQISHTRTSKRVLAMVACLFAHRAKACGQ